MAVIRNTTDYSSGSSLSQADFDLALCGGTTVSQLETQNGSE